MVYSVPEDVVYIYCMFCKILKLYVSTQSNLEGNLKAHLINQLESMREEVTDKRMAAKERTKRER